MLSHLIGVHVKVQLGVACPIKFIEDRDLELMRDFYLREPRKGAKINVNIGVVAL